MTFPDSFPCMRSYRPAAVCPAFFYFCFDRSKCSEADSNFSRISAKRSNQTSGIGGEDGFIELLVSEFGAGGKQPLIQALYYPPSIIFISSSASPYNS
jgi:hypothetical protein